MKVVATGVNELRAGDCRLDASYHASEGVKVLRTLRRWVGHSTPTSKRGVLREHDRVYATQRLERLDEVCQPGGIFIPSRFKRIFVDDAAHGAPYLTGGSIMQADPLMGAKLLSYKFTLNMAELVLRERMILITCSGTIGNSVYVNANFCGTVGSPDLLRIEADTAKIPPGYLYTFLSGPLGKALIEQKTYGAVVPHIEAHHVVDLPIPRLDVAIEERIHTLVERAASLRVDANNLIDRACEDLLLQSGLSSLTSHDYYFYGSSRVGREPGCFAVDSSRLSTLTINAWNYGSKFHAIRQRVLQKSNVLTLREVIAPNGYFSGGWYKRVPTTEGYGVELLTQKQLFNLRKQGNWIASGPIGDLDAEKVDTGTILIAGVGTMGETEVFGRCEFVWRNLEEKLVVAEVVRVMPNTDLIDAGYLFAYLGSNYGFRLLRSTVSGTKLCRFIEPLALSIPVPILSVQQQTCIGDWVRQAYDNRAEAVLLEDQAQALLIEALGLV